ncbi:hypothetical protein A2U01_0075345, partial [Trifolium medium]|nr:hypothetical protein [Trifolium medium]
TRTTSWSGDDGQEQPKFRLHAGIMPPGEDSNRRNMKGYISTGEGE